MNDDLSTLLHDRLSDVHPDLDALAAGAVRRGRRIRAVRRSGVALGTAAAVAAVGIGVASMTGGSATSTPQYASGGDSPGASTSPAPPPLHAHQVLRLGGGVTGFVDDSQLTLGRVEALVAVPDPGESGPDSGLTITLSGSRGALNRFLNADDDATLANTYPGVSVAAPMGFLGNTAAKPERAPFTVTLDGWTCGDPGDEKMICHGPGNASAEIVWRPADLHADYAGGDPDKTGDYVSDVHGKWFATVDGDNARAVGESLAWDN